MANPENITNLTKEQLSANGKKGAQRSAEIRRQKKAMREEMIMMLSLPVKRSIRNAANKMLTIDKAKALADFSSRNTTVQTQILLKLTQMAMSGNIKAMQLIMDLTGETNSKSDISISVDNSTMEYYERLSSQLKARKVDGVEDD
jgi:hypothetical protein